MMDLKLNSPWHVSLHGVYEKNWTLASYKDVCTLTSFRDFWYFINNFKFFNYTKTHFFVMRNGINPLWEDEENRNGGICKIQFTLLLAVEAWELLLLLTLNESILQTKNHLVNGISFNPKSNCVIIKIWSNNGDVDISKLLNQQILDKYKNLSIKHSRVVPEY